jgi:two-component system response regulator YesN
MLKVFIVEDEEIIRRGLISTIDWRSMDSMIVGDAPDGEAAWAQLEAAQPDVILTDIRMPRLDGLGLAQRLQERGSRARIVFLTSYADFDYAREAIRLQAADYLLKPIDGQAIAKVLARLQAEKAGTVLPGLTDATARSAWEKLQWQGYQPGSPYVRAVRAAIQQDYQQKLSLETIAAEQGVSSSYLSRKLKEETGQTFCCLLAKYRLQQSIALLAAGTWRIYEIAEKTGFGDYKNFCQAFHKYLHTSPSDFMQTLEGRHA